jgi:hypothetical protein
MIRKWYRSVAVNSARTPTGLKLVVGVVIDLRLTACTSSMKGTNVDSRPGISTQEIIEQGNEAMK